MTLSGLRRWSRSCLTMQGYGALDDEERRTLWLGLRFAPALCLTGMAVGVALESPAVLLAVAATAFVGGFVAPKHPFDLLWDRGVRHLLGHPPVPPSPPPRRFACQLATVWLAAVAAAFLMGADALAWALGIPLVGAAALVTTTNWCLPSFIYGLLHRRSMRPLAS